MNDTTIGKLRSFSLNARALLEQEIGEQLEGLYGWLPNGDFADPKLYPALELPESEKTRKRLEQWVEDEKEAGLDRAGTRDKLVREAAYTWLNRLTAFRMMETRGLIRETVKRGTDSNGFKRWLTRHGNEKWLENYEQGDLPQNEAGEGPRQKAYRHFILHRCAELSQEIKVLFDPGELASQIFPRLPALKELLGMMDAPELEEAWSPESDETIGWIYQFFNSEELEAAFKEARTSGRKFEAQDIPSVTQLFTPRWIVRFLVENSLGRFWIDMHPDSKLWNKFDYIVPRVGTRQMPMKAVKDITFLDPACGTMHFGLVAFDLFVAMYEEEMENAGQDGWPGKASLEDSADIPASIVANNIFGADIDMRAVQLSALTLYLKAKSLNKDADITASNLACANAHLLNGDRMQAFIEKTGLKRPIYRRILEELKQQLENSEQLGTLLRLESAIPALVEKERQWYLKEGRQTDLPGFGEKQLDLEVGKEEFWEMLESQIEQALNLFIKESGQDEQFFADEAQKGLRLLDIVSRKYDIVTTNPPYMSARKMNSTLKKLVKDRYPEGKRDLYAAFLLRCNELVAHHGRVGMLTMHSFMFISSYEKMRNWFRERIALDAVAHCGPALFAVGNPGTLQTVATVFRREPDEQKRENSIGTYFRLVKGPDSDSKRKRFEEANAKLRADESDPIVYKYKQSNFDAIPGSPWVYWISPGMRPMFNEFPLLGKVGKPRQGLATADNTRFLRYWWEVGVNQIGFGAINRKNAVATGKKWFPYMKGGASIPWYGNQECIVNWCDDGAEIRNLGVESGKLKSRPQNTDYYFRRGVTWSLTSSKTFAARLSPGGFIFDVNGMTCFPEEEDIPLILAYLNSRVAQQLLHMLNPTIASQVGDIERLPVPLSGDRLDIGSLVDQAVDLSKTISATSERCFEFDQPFRTPARIRNLHSQLSEANKTIDSRMLDLYGIEERLLEPDIDSVKSMDVDPFSVDGTVHKEERDLSDKPDLCVCWLSYAFGIAIGRFHPGVEGALGCGDFSDEINKKLQNLADPDGIMVMDEGHSDDVVRNVLECLTIMLGEDEAGEVVRTATGKSGDPEKLLRDYLEKKFFKDHIQLYRKRPVYWFLQSPHKRYGIWIFHECFTHDTLFRINEIYIQPRINLLENRVRELQESNAGASGAQATRNEREIGRLNDVLDDVKEFQQRIKAITDRGYTPHIDDGVLINMAPLWEIVPSWQAEPKKAWKKLENGDWDWSYQAMDHWPERVREKCKANKSFAIAHGLEDIYEG